MVVIRLSRSGSKKRVFYHVVAADKRSARDGRNIEELGYFNPIAKGEGDDIRIHLNMARIDYWVSCGAQPSERVERLIKDFRKMPPREEKPKKEKVEAKPAAKAKPTASKTTAAAKPKVKKVKVESKSEGE